MTDEEGLEEIRVLIALLDVDSLDMLHAMIEVELRGRGGIDAH